MCVRLCVCCGGGLNQGRTLLPSDRVKEGNLFSMSASGFKGAELDVESGKARLILLLITLELNTAGVCGCIWGCV